MKNKRVKQFIEEQTGVRFDSGVSLAKYLGLKQSTSISAAIRRHGFYLNRKTNYTYVYAKDFTGLKKPFTGKRNRRWNDITDNFGNMYTSLTAIASLYTTGKRERGILTIKIMKDFETKGNFVGPDGKIFVPNSCTVPNTDRESIDNTEFVKQAIAERFDRYNKLISTENIRVAKEVVKENIVKRVKFPDKVDESLKKVLAKLLEENKIESMYDILDAMLEKENY